MAVPGGQEYLSREEHKRQEAHSMIFLRIKFTNFQESVVQGLPELEDAFRPL